MQEHTKPVLLPIYAAWASVWFIQHVFFDRSMRIMRRPALACQLLNPMPQDTTAVPLP